MTTFVETKITEDAVTVLNTDSGTTYGFRIIGDPRGEFTLAPTAKAEEPVDPTLQDEARDAHAFAEAILKKMV